jgi:hypothetical protein
MVTKLISLPYELARLPWSVVDSALSDGLPRTSRPRVILDKALGSADRIAGSVLRDRDLARRGADRLDRTSRLLTAERLEQEAEARREQAEQAEAALTREAERTREAAEERAESALEEADAVRARRRQEATSRAAQRAAATKDTADRLADRRTAAAEQRRRSAEQVAEADKRAAQREVKAELDEATTAKRTARQARQDAERLDGLVEAKKAERTED